MERPASLSLFPGAQWGTVHVQFHPAAEVLPDSTQVRTVLIFLQDKARFVLCDIVGRGWCIPGGHLEAGESPEAGARREVWEEAGAQLGELKQIGSYLLTDTRDNSISAASVYIARTVAWEAIPEGSESRGVRLADLQELPNIYYTWDPLIAAVFAYAHDCLTALLV